MTLDERAKTHPLPPIPARARADTLGSRAYESIRLAILAGSFINGPLYSESEVAQALGTSRTPVRQALQRLALEGLIEIFPQSGFKVRTIGAAEYKEHYGLREAIETYVVSVLCERIDSSGDKVLQQHWEAQHAARTDPVEFINRDEAFHLSLAELAGLPRAAQMVATLRGVMWLLGTTVLAYQDRRDLVLKEHRAIIDAVSSRDADRAVEAMTTHIRHTAKAALASSRATASERISDLSLGQ